LGSLLAVNILGPERPFAHDARASVSLEPPKKAALITFVTNARAKGLNQDQQRVGIAVKAKLAQPQDVPAGLSLFPKAIARSGKEMNLACRLRLRQCIRIQIADHQHVLRAVILNHRREQPSLLFERKFHGCLPKQKNRWAIRASGLFKLFSKERASQASVGAAAGRDGDGVDAPGETLRLKIHHETESR